MIIARPILMGSPKAGPLTDQWGRAGSRPDEAGEQVAHFRGGEWDEWLGRQDHLSWLSGRQLPVLMHAHADQEGRGQQDQGDMAIPADVTAHFILDKSKIFAGLQILFDMPTRTNGAHDGGERRSLGSKDQVVSQFVRGVPATTNRERSAPSRHTTSTAAPEVERAG